MLGRKHRKIFQLMVQTHLVCSGNQPWTVNSISAVQYLQSMNNGYYKQAPENENSVNNIMELPFTSVVHE